MSKAKGYIELHEMQLTQIRNALMAARPYVECCAEPDKSDGASAALQQIDDALAIHSRAVCLNRISMIDKDMVMACVLARLQAEGKELNAISQDEVGTLIAEAIADLRLANDVVTGTR